MVVDERVGITDLGHLPQAIGILIARINPGGSSYNQIYYTGVFFNWITSTALIFLSIKYVRKFKWAFFIIATLPTVVFLSCGLGYDALTNAICLLFFSLVVNLYIQKRNITTRRLVALIGVSVGAVLTKQTNALLLLFILFLPSVTYSDLPLVKNKISGRMRHLFLFLGCLLLVCIAAIAIGKYTDSLATGLNSTRLGGVYEAVKALFNSIFRNDLAQLHNPNWQRSGPDGVMRAVFTYKVLMPFWVLFLYAISILVVFIKSGEEATLRIIKRLAFVSTAVFAVITLAIWIGMLSMFVGFTDLTSIIDGVQGRYFSAYIILLLPLIIYLAHLFKITIGVGSKKLPVFCLAIAVSVNVYSLYLMHASYYLNLYNPLAIL